MYPEVHAVTQHSLPWSLRCLPLVSPREEASGACDDVGVGDDAVEASKSEKLAFEVLLIFVETKKLRVMDFDDLSTTREEPTSETLLTIDLDSHIPAVAVSGPFTKCDDGFHLHVARRSHRQRAVAVH